MSEQISIIRGDYLGYKYHVYKYKDPDGSGYFKMRGLCYIPDNCTLKKLIDKTNGVFSIRFNGLLTDFKLCEYNGQWCLVVAHGSRQNSYTHGASYIRGKILGIIRRIRDGQYVVNSKRNVFKPDTVK